MLPLLLLLPTLLLLTGEVARGITTSGEVRRKERAGGFFIFFQFLWCEACMERGICVMAIAYHGMVMARHGMAQGISVDSIDQSVSTRERPVLFFSPFFPGH